MNSIKMRKLKAFSFVAALLFALPANAGITSKTYVNKIKSIFASTAAGVAATATTNSNTYLNTIIETTNLSSLRIIGDGVVSVSATSAGVLTISGTDTSADKLKYPPSSWSVPLDPGSHSLFYWKVPNRSLDSGYKLDSVVVKESSYDNTNQTLALIKPSGGKNGETIIADSGITRTQLLDVINGGGGGGGLSISGTVGNLVAVGPTSTQITGTTIVANDVVQKGTALTANQIVVAETATAPVKIKTTGIAISTLNDAISNINNVVTNYLPIIDALQNLSDCANEWTFTSGFIPLEVNCHKTHNIITVTFVLQVDSSVTQWSMAHIGDYVGTPVSFNQVTTMPHKICTTYMVDNGGNMPEVTSPTLIMTGFVFLDNADQLMWKSFLPLGVVTGSTSYDYGLVKGQELYIDCTFAIGDEAKK